MASNQLKNVRFKSGGKDYDLFDYLAENRIAGLLILKDGKVAFEDYELGATPITRCASFSMAKSVSSTLVGAALQQGLISSLDVPVSRYVPALKVVATTELAFATCSKWRPASSGTKPIPIRNRTLVSLAYYC